MSQPVYIEYQDLKVRVNTSDAALASCSERTVRSIDPDGNRVDYTGNDVTVEDTYLAAQMVRANLKRGRWRFSASGIDAGGKLRKTKWFWLYINAEGEV